MDLSCKDTRHLSGGVRAVAYRKHVGRQTCIGEAIDYREKAGLHLRGADRNENEGLYVSWKRNTPAWGRLLTIGVAGFLVIGCSDRATEPKGNRPTLMRAASVSSEYNMNTASDRLSAELADFGGAFVDGGYLNLFLKSSDTATASLRHEQAAQVARGFLARLDRAELPVRILSGKYSFVELRAWETLLRTEYFHLKVHTAGIDERRNQLRIVVPSDRDRSEVLRTLGELDVPHDAARVELAEPGIEFASLTDKVRPTAGGLYIATFFSWEGDSYSEACTYGFNAQLLGSSERYMVTNAHCVQPPGTFGGLIGALVSQPDDYTSSLVGEVVLNPNTFTGFGCPALFQCRYSDAVLVKVTGLSGRNWELGRIARTVDRDIGPYSSGSLAIDGTNPRIAIADHSSFFVGDTLEKIGARTGWTAGVVTSSCTFHSVGPFGRLCDGVVAAGGARGDSGAPVFWKAFDGRYYLMGLLWGGPAAGSEIASEYWFSQWDNIEADLSPYQIMIVGN